MLIHLLSFSGDFSCCCACGSILRRCIRRRSTRHSGFGGCGRFRLLFLRVSATTSGRRRSWSIMMSTTAIRIIVCSIVGIKKQHEEKQKKRTDQLLLSRHKYSFFRTQSRILYPATYPSIYHSSEPSLWNRIRKRFAQGIRFPEYMRNHAKGAEFRPPQKVLD